MVRVARFEKVSLRRFVTDWVATFPQQTVEQAVAAYERIRLPERATSGSAGYDLFAPVGFELGAGEGIKIPTGLRVLIEEGWVLTIYPRSGLGFKYRFQLDNSVGVIDSDYARSDNEGHIFMRMTNDNREGKSLIVPSGTAFAQGIFLPFGIAVDERRITVQDVFDAADNGTLEEAFGSGTAAVVSPVGRLAWKDREISISGGQIGKLTQDFYDTLTGIQYGEREDPFGWVVKLS